MEQMAHKRSKKPAPRTKAPNGAGSVVVDKLAYELWLNRGCPNDSPEQDWYEAERILKGSAENMGTSASDEISAEPRSHRSKARASGA